MTQFASLAPLFLIGLTYSLYHCVGMCGGFVMAYSATCTQGGGRAREQWPLHLLFNLGRVTSYTLIGAVWGALGGWASYYGYSGTRLQGITAIVGGILMILFGISLAGAFKMPAGSMLGGSLTRKAFGRLLRTRSVLRTYPLGLLVGTVPCGLVYSMSSYAFASGSAGRGALAMAAFGMGTIPAMFTLGFASGILSARVRKGMLHVAVAITVLMGIEAIRRGVLAL